MRRDIAERKLQVLRWPADGPCPVEKGERFKVLGFVIEIETIQRKLIPGKPAEYHVTFIRHEPDRVYLLRQGKPVNADQKKDVDIDLPAAERARRDGEYTASRVSAMQMEPESVGPEWKDKHAPRNEERRQRDRSAVRGEDEVRKHIRRMKLQASRVVLETHRGGKDITHMLADIYARLAQQAEENKRAA